MRETENMSTQKPTRECSHNVITAKTAKKT